MTTSLSHDELTREGIQALCRELGVAKAMRFLAEWSRRNQTVPRREYADIREEQLGQLSMDELAARIRAWEQIQDATDDKDVPR
jgi:hypothetical protein